MEENTADTKNEGVSSGEVDQFGHSALSFIEPQAVDEPAETEETNEEGENQPKKEESRASILERLKEKVFGPSDKKEQEAENTGSKQEFEEDISDSFVAVAKKSGWTDDAIIEFAETYSNAELEKMIPLIVDEARPTEEKKEATKEVLPQKKIEVSDKTNTKIDNKAIEPYLEEIRKKIAEEYEKKYSDIQKKMEEVDTERKSASLKQYQTSADVFFDKTAKDFPVFGKTEELLRFPPGSPKAGQIVPAGPAFESRSAVYKTALSFHQMGETWEKSLDEALAWYRGKNLEKEIRSKVLKDLKQNEKRLSPKRTERSSTKEMNSRRDIIDELATRAGIS